MNRRKKFVLHLVSREVTTSTLEVEADSESEARGLFAEGDVDMNEMISDESPMQPLWEIEEVKKGGINHA